MTTNKTSFINNYDDMILSPVMRELYNNSAFYNVGYWENASILLKDACQSLVEKHLALVSTEKPLHILDVGCGLGATTNTIKEKFPNAKVTGINISERQVSFAREHYPACNFEVMDAAQLTFPEDHFDLIISVEAVFHFQTREEFLKEAYRILKPDGELIFTDILLHDSHWVGNWSVPKENMLRSVELYQQLLQETAFSIRVSEDITANSWMGFCEHIRKNKNMVELANGLQESIIAYLLMKLKKQS